MEAALTLAAIFALSCTGKPTSTSSTNVTPGSAVVAPVDAATSNRVTDRKTAEANLGQAVEVHGTARNAKLAAAVVAGDAVVYCMGVESWPTELANQPVVARGTIERTSELSTNDADGEVRAGPSGAILVLRSCTYATP